MENYPLYLKVQILLSLKYCCYHALQMGGTWAFKNKKRVHSDSCQLVPDVQEDFSFESLLPYTPFHEPLTTNLAPMRTRVSETSLTTTLRTQHFHISGRARSGTGSPRIPILSLKSPALGSSPSPTGKVYSYFMSPVVSSSGIWLLKD